VSQMRRFSLLLVALLLVPFTSRGQGPLLKLPDDVFDRSRGEDVVDVLYSATGGAAIVRLHVTVESQSFRTCWRDFVVRLHAFLDRDDDHVLTAAEAARVPLTSFLGNPINGIQTFRPGMGSTSIDANPRDGKVTFGELVTYLQKTYNFEPLGAQSGAAPDWRAEAMFRQLDRDGDMVITPAELSRTDELVAKLDRDEDEVLSFDELTPDRSPLADRFARVNAGGNLFDPSKSAAIPLTSSELRVIAAKRLLDGFGKGTPRKIGRKPLGADPTNFRAADADSDGLLDRDELMRYLESPTAHQELDITFSRARSGRGRIEKAPAQVGSASGGEPPARRTGANGAFVVEVAGSEIEFLANETLINRAALFENQFRNADADKDGAIDANEARTSPFIQRLHPAADRNGDGRMTQSELRVYLDLTNAAEEARMILTVSDQGIALHERLDANHDGRLSVRELRGSPSIMANLDSDHDGRFSFSELPRRTQLNVGRGALQNRNRVLVASAATNNSVGVSGDRPTLPAWFVAMDRNHDGDVSPREFLGTSDQFRHFDADGDGLIDGDEAARNP
jgi:Ca2+-binding EF-hand superfamily protein